MTCVWQASIQANAPPPKKRKEKPFDRHTSQRRRQRPPSLLLPHHTQPAFCAGRTQSVGIALKSIEIFIFARVNYDHHASNRPVQAKWHNISVCFHCPQKKIITSHLQTQKPIEAIITQNILFVTDSKWCCIFLPHGSDVNLLKHDVVKWQKQKTHFHALSFSLSHTHINFKCHVTPRRIMNNMNQCHHYPSQCICYHCSNNEVSVWWLV